MIMIQSNGQQLYIDKYNDHMVSLSLFRPFEKKIADYGNLHQRMDVSIEFTNRFTIKYICFTLLLKIKFILKQKTGNSESFCTMLAVITCAPFTINDSTQHTDDLLAVANYIISQFIKCIGIQRCIDVFF